MDLDEEPQPDGRLLYGWIALNSLFGSWDVRWRLSSQVP
jgi:hypothetical protein